MQPHTHTVCVYEANAHVFGKALTDSFAFFSFHKGPWVIAPFVEGAADPFICVGIIVLINKRVYPPSRTRSHNTKTTIVRRAHKTIDENNKYEFDRRRKQLCMISSQLLLQADAILNCSKYVFYVGINVCTCV